MFLSSSFFTSNKSFACIIILIIQKWRDFYIFFLQVLERVNSEARAISEQDEGQGGNAGLEEDISSNPAVANTELNDARMMEDGGIELKVTKAKEEIDDGDKN